MIPVPQNFLRLERNSEGIWFSLYKSQSAEKERKLYQEDEVSFAWFMGLLGFVFHPRVAEHRPQNDS